MPTTILRSLCVLVFCLCHPAKFGFCADAEEERLRREEAQEKAALESSRLKPEQIGLCAGFSMRGMSADSPAFSEHLEQMVDLGVGWIRWPAVMDGLRGDSPAEFRFDRLAAVVDRFRDSGISVLLVLDAPAQFEKNEMAPYLEFVSKTVSFFKGRVTHYEILNEPHRADSPLTAYARWVLEADRAAKTADSACVVLANPMGRAASGRREVLVEFLKALGKGRRFDILALRAYRAELGPTEKSGEGLTTRDEIEEVRKTLDRNGYPHAPIWITEISWPTRGDTPPGTDANGMGIRSEEKQAEYLTDIYSLMRDQSYLEKIFWFKLMDAPPDPREDRFDHGLLRSDGSPKKAYHAYKHLTW